jgi:hypothetical protein
MLRELLKLATTTLVHQCRVQAAKPQVAKLAATTLASPQACSPCAKLQKKLWMLQSSHQKLHNVLQSQPSQQQKPQPPQPPLQMKNAQLLAPDTKAATKP